MSQTVMITGANRGLGEALFWAFKEQGYRCVLNCRTEAPEHLNENDDYVVFGDITDPWTINRLGQVAMERGVTTLINNAGIHDSHHFSVMDYDECKRIIDTNLLGAIAVTRAVWPAFIAKGRGAVVNINSVAGMVGSDGETAYCASKHGLAGFSKALQFDGSRDNIRIMNLYFGAMKTDMTKDRLDHDKMIDPIEAAHVIYRLCKDYLTLRITEATILRSQY